MTNNVPFLPGRSSLPHEYAVSTVIAGWHVHCGTTTTCPLLPHCPIVHHVAVEPLERLREPIAGSITLLKVGTLRKERSGIGDNRTDDCWSSLWESRISKAGRVLCRPGRMLDCSTWGDAVVAAKGIRYASIDWLRLPRLPAKLPRDEARVRCTQPF